MTMTLTIPDDIAVTLEAQLGEPSRAALEALAARAYAAGNFGVEQVRRLLDFPSRWEAQALLSKFGVWPGLSDEEILEDVKTALEFHTVAATAK